MRVPEFSLEPSFTDDFSHVQEEAKGLLNLAQKYTF